jgi:hypothetical protein
MNVASPAAGTAPALYEVVQYFGTVPSKPVVRSGDVQVGKVVEGR